MQRLVCLASGFAGLLCWVACSPCRFACPPDCMFFVASRRRHTRWTGDWSSDVCSSDLTMLQGSRSEEATCQRAEQDQPGPRGARSEERRVGKECRSRWSPDHQKKKK